MIAIVSPITSYFWEHFVMPIFGIKVELSNRTWRIPDMFIMVSEVKGHLL